MAKISLDFKGFNEVLKKLHELEADVKPIAEEALTKTHEIVTKKAEDAVKKPYLPAGGKYSTGATEESINRTPKITWSGTVAAVSVGYNIKKGGLPSIFMLYGSPRYMKVQAVYDAFYSDQTQGEYINAQKEIFYKAIGELEG